LQRPVLYLGEINDSQREAWIRSIEVFDEEQGCQNKMALFAADRPIPPGISEGIGVRLSEFVLKRPRQWGRLLVVQPVMGTARVAGVLAAKVRLESRRNRVGTRAGGLKRLPVT
jgi:hypothetical protein